MAATKKQSGQRQEQVYFSTRLRKAVRCELKIAAARDGKTVEEKLDEILCERLGMDHSTLRSTGSSSS